MTDLCDAAAASVVDVDIKGRLGDALLRVAAALLRVRSMLLFCLRLWSRSVSGHFIYLSWEESGWKG